MRSAGLCMRRGVGRNVSVGGRVRVERTARDRSEFSNQVQVSHDRELIARFFMDLRRALRLTLPQAAHYLKVHTGVLEALETGQVEYLPPWPQTVQIVMGYTSMAGVDGRPVLNAIGNLIMTLQPSPDGAVPAGCRRTPFTKSANGRSARFTPCRCRCSSCCFSMPRSCRWWRSRSARPSVMSAFIFKSILHRFRMVCAGSK